MSTRLFAFTVRRPVALLVIFATLLVVGGVAYQRTPLQLLPSGFQEPRLAVWIPNPGSSAVENEEKVARPIEEQLRTLSGLTNVYSTSREGLVQLYIQLDPNLDLDLAKAEVRDRIERARPTLPETVEDIGIWSESADQLPLAFFGLRRPDNDDRADYLVEEVAIPRLEAIDGVANVQVWGLLQESVRILLDEDAVRAANLDVGQLIQRMSSDNFATPLGELDDGGRWTILRSDMRFGSLEEIAAYPIGDGLVIGDVGEVRKVKSVRDRLTRIDGQYAFFGIATKESQANVVEASHALRTAMAEVEADPRAAGELEFVDFFVQGDMIESSLTQLRETALWGGGLAVVVLLLFLRRLRLTLCVALSIPVSALLALAWEFFSGGSFNVLTMTGITLGIGMLVDNSVVVVENIVRVRGLGVPPRDAAARGASEIALAVTLATMTTVVVFAPMIFLTENPIARTMFAGIGVPLCLSLVASLFIALVFLPAATARMLGRGVAAPDGEAPTTLWGAPARGFARAFALLVGAVRLLLHVVVVAAHKVERAAVAVLGGPLRFLLAAGLVALAVLTWRSAAPALDLGLAHGWSRGGDAKDSAQLLATAVALPTLVAVALLLVGAPRWRRRPALPPARPDHFVPRGATVLGLVQDLNRRVVAWSLAHRLGATGLAVAALFTVTVPMSRLELAAFGEDGGGAQVEFYVRLDADFTLSEAAQEMRVYEEFIESKRDAWGYSHWRDNFSERGGELAMYWEEPVSREDRNALEASLMAELPRLPGHRLRFYNRDNVGDRDRSVARFTLRGTDSKELDRLGTEAAAVLAEVDGLSDVTNPLEDVPDQLEVDIDRDLALSRGVVADATTNTIQWALRGWMLPRFQEEGREVPLLIEFDEEDVAGLSTLRDLGVWTTTGGSVPLSSFAKIRTAKGSRTIRRVNGQTTFELYGRLDEGARREEVEEAGYAALAANLDLPRGFSFGDENSARRRQEQEFQELRAAALLSLVLVFLLMGILLESVLLPFSVIFTVPFAWVGALWVLMVTGTPMDSMGWIGLIILGGVVVNNGIVLIDRIHRLAGSGMPRDEAVLTGCAQRVRPILMTAMTTVFGLMPMIVREPATDAVPYRALAAIVAGGLVTSTFFTLWVVPLAYTVLDDLWLALKRRAGWQLRWVRRAEGA